MKTLFPLVIAVVLGNVVLAQNNVGIGTNTPLSTIDVNGAIGTGIKTLTSSQTLDNTAGTILANPSGGAFTLTLPVLSTSAHRIYNIIYLGSPGGNAVTIQGNAGGDNITVGGTSANTFALTEGSIILQNNGSAWFATVVPANSGSGNYIQNQNSSTQTATFKISGTGTLGGITDVGTANVNASGSAATNIGNASSTTTVTGPANVNTSGSAGTTIGNASSITTVTGPANVNTSGSAGTTIGNASSTTTITGGTNINTSGSGTTAIGNGVNALIENGNVTINNSNGSASTNIGTGTTTGTITIGGTSTQSSGQTINIGSNNNASNATNITGGSTSGVNINTGNTGTVTIGDGTSPTSTVKVVGLAVSSPVYTNASGLLTTTPSTTGSQGFWTVGGTSNDRLYPTNIADSIGIGTNSPLSLLDISNSTTSDTKHNIINSNTSSGNVGLELRSHATASGTVQQYIDFTGGSTSDYGTGTPDFTNRIISNATNLSISSSSATGIVLTNSTGYVGIGSTTPATYLQLGNTNNSANAYATFAAGNGAQFRTWQIGVPYGGTTTSEPYYGFAITDANVSTSVTSASTPFFIDYSTHNVGVNYASPQVPLDVRTTATAGTGTSIAWIGSSASPRFEFIDELSSSSLGAKLYFGSANISQIASGGNFAIMAASNLGIGTTTPLYKLHTYTTTSGDGIFVDGNTNVGLMLATGGSQKAAFGLAETSGAWSTDAAVGDAILRSSSSQKLIFNTNAGTGSSTMYLSGSNVNVPGLAVSSAVYTDASHNLTTTPPTGGLSWSTTGNTGTTPTSYNDNGAQTNNFMGTTDNNPVYIYTNSSANNNKTNIGLLTSTSTGAAITTPSDIFQIRRNGTTGVNYPGVASFALGKYAADISSESVLAIKLGNGNVYTPDVTVMTLQGNGTVGIGTTSPGSNLLNVSTAASSGAANGIYLAAQTAGGGNSGGSVTITSGQNGSTSNGGGSGAVNILGANAAASSYGVNGGSVNITAGSAYNAGGSGAGGSVNITAGGNQLGANSYGNINFYTYANSGTSTSEAMFINGSNNNVGLGTNNTSPYTTLDVLGNVITTAHANSSEHSTSEQGSWYMGHQAGNNWGSDGFAGMKLIVQSGNAGCGNTGDIAFYTWQCNTSSQRAVMYAAGSGNIGIGTTSPSTLLAVNGTTQTNKLQVGSSNGTVINHMEAGSVSVPALSGCSGGGCVQTVSIGLNFPSGVTPFMVCTVQNQSGTSYSDTYATQVRSISNSSATVNVCRTDAYYNGEGWGQAATLAWIAWY